MTSSIEIRRAFTCICVHILKICYAVLAVVRVANVVCRDMLVATGGLQDTVDQLRDGFRVVLLVLVIPVGGNLLRRATGTKDVGCICGQVSTARAKHGRYTMFYRRVHARRDA